MFYFIAALMVLLALGFILVPLLRRPGTESSTSIEAANIEAFRVQRREVEADHERGLITQAERDRIVEELGGRLAEEIESDVKPQQIRSFSGINAPKRPWILMVVLSVFIVGGSVGGYVVWGAHDAQPPVSPVAAVENASGDANAPLSDKQVLALVENLAKKMEANPTDPNGWILLGRSQNALGQWGAAASAFERALALTPNDAQLLADYADVQAMVQEGSFVGKPIELARRALKIDPKNMKALALVGTAEMRAGNKDASLKHWQSLLAVLPKDSEDAAQVAAIINEIKTGRPGARTNAAEGVGPPAEKSAPGAAEKGAQRAAEKGAQRAAEKGAPTAPERGKVVRGEVSVAPALAGAVGKDDTLFILARAVNGPKMPLAVLRIPAPTTWPYRFELSDAMAMAPGMNLSSFPQVIIEARISKRGNAPLQPGDLQGLSGAVTPPASGIKLIIDKVAP